MLYSRIHIQMKFTENNERENKINNPRCVVKKYVFVVQNMTRTKNNKKKKHIIYRRERKKTRHTHSHIHLNTPHVIYI